MKLLKAQLLLDLIYSLVFSYLITFTCGLFLPHFREGQEKQQHKQQLNFTADFKHTRAAGRLLGILEQGLGKHSMHMRVCMCTPTPHTLLPSLSTVELLELQHIQKA